MNLILIVLTSTIISACFFAIYHYAYEKGYKKATEDIDKDAYKITDRNSKNAYRKASEFANYQG